MIKDYLPKYMQEFREISEICNSEDLLLSEFSLYKNTIQNEFFIESAGNIGLKRAENLLGIVSSADESNDFRRFRIKLKLYGTGQKLIEGIENILPNKDYKIAFLPNLMLLNVRLSVGNKMYLNAIKEFLDKIVPMNINLNCSVLYTPHNYLKGYTHNVLKNYKNIEIKEDLYEQ